jgi:hypothetical protein
MFSRPRSLVSALALTTLLALPRALSAQTPDAPATDLVQLGSADLDADGAQETVSVQAADDGRVHVFVQRQGRPREELPGTYTRPENSFSLEGDCIRISTLQTTLVEGWSTEEWVAYRAGAWRVVRSRESHDDLARGESSVRSIDYERHTADERFATRGRRPLTRRRSVREEAPALSD